jgi:hypothetical protein
MFNVFTSDSIRDPSIINTEYLFESKIYVGRLLSGKTTACCLDAWDMIYKHNAVVIAYDCLLSTKNTYDILKKSYKNVSYMNEKEFLDNCQIWIESGEDTDNFHNLNRMLGNKDVKRNDQYPSIIIIENFHRFEDKRKVSELIQLSHDKNVYFYITSQSAFVNNLLNFDLKHVAPYVFSVSDKESLILLGHDLASKIVEYKSFYSKRSKKLESHNSLSHLVGFPSRREQLSLENQIILRTELDKFGQ